MIARIITLSGLAALLLFSVSCNKEKRYLQTRLDAGESITELLEDFPVDSFYAKSYAGGLIIDLNPAGSGIVMGKTDLNSDATWGCNSSPITGAEGSAVGTGQANSTSITNQCSDPNTAVAYCTSSTAEGYDDWYLPSQGELIRAYSRLHIQGKGDFTNLFYWSSTQVDQSTAKHVLFSNGSEGTGTKTNLNHVRAARSFTF